MTTSWVHETHYYIFFCREMGNRQKCSNVDEAAGKNLSDLLRENKVNSNIKVYEVGS